MKKYWIPFILVIVLSFGVLGWVGSKIYQQVPPIPSKVVTDNGEVIFTQDDIQTGQNVWQAMGGMECGSVWGHGSYVAPDWTADWLHRELIIVLNDFANRDYNKSFNDLSDGYKSLLKAKVRDLYRINTFDEKTNVITINSVRAKAVEQNVEYYSKLFTNGKEEYAIRKNTLSDPIKLKKLGAFFFWSSWAASTNRPGEEITYTHNWPHEELIGNKPTGDTIVWTGVSIILLLLGIGGMAFFYASRKHEPMTIDYPVDDPLLGSKATPSQKAVIKYFWVVSGLILLQIIFGVITAHYGVEGDAFYGIPLSKILPYSITRTWHTQLGIFWIATAWLAAGLYIGPAS